MNTSDFAQRLADKLIAQLKEGTAPWQKPWAEGQSFSPYLFEPTSVAQIRPKVMILDSKFTQSVHDETTY